MPSLIAIGSTMAEVALDANVIVGILYEGDVHHQRAKQLRSELRRDGHEVVILDFLLHEAVSVLCRRAKERKVNPPDLRAALGVVRGWFESGGIRLVGRESERLAADVLDVVSESNGVLNFNDASGALASCGRPMRRTPTSPGSRGASRRSSGDCRHPIPSPRRSRPSRRSTAAERPEGSGRSVGSR